MAALTNEAINYAKTAYLTAKTYGGYNDTTSKLIANQAAHESNYFTSALFKRANNAVGMTVATKRPHTHQLKPDRKQPDGNSRYAAYASLQDCIKDLCDYLKYNRFDENKITTPAQYATWLKSKGYYGAPFNEYYIGLIRAAAALNPLLKFSPLIILFFLSIAIFLLTR